MSHEITTTEGGSIIGAFLALGTTVVGAFRLQSQIAKLRLRVTTLSATLDAVKAKAEADVAEAKAETRALEERLASLVSDALAAHPSFADPPPIRQSTGSMPTSEALERIVAEKVAEYGRRADAAQDAKIEGIAARVGDVAQMLTGIVGRIGSQ